jgi:hypothetical protein
VTARSVGVLPVELGRGAKPATTRKKSTKPPRTRRRTWKQFSLALLVLAYVLGIAIGTLLLGGLVLHALVPHRVIDIFAALHNEIVTGVLLGLLALWLLPPYPWAAPQPPIESRTSARAVAEPKGSVGIVADLSRYARVPIHRPLPGGDHGMTSS